ncbi:MAG TPA: hypothetical protein PKL15_06705 [Saprospiraceae bacterium]|nr:hypothetical protein [Saprospiraceae bacterium]
MFALAFTFCAVMAFASNPAAVQKALTLTGTPVQDDVPCLACAPCNGRIYCVFGLTCESANENLDDELKEMGCGGDTNKPTDDDDDSGE